MTSYDLGLIGQRKAVEFLQKNMYSIMHENYRIKDGEIDIIAEKDNIVVFVEVKLRRNLSFGLPMEAVNIRKQRKITKVAKYYISQYNLYNTDFRFDVIEVYLNKGQATVNHIQNAFWN